MNDTKKEHVKEIEKTKKWYKFSKEKGRYLLGLVVTFAAYGVYQSTPSALLVYDAKGTSSYIECTSAFVSDDVKFDPSPCKYYFETYIPERLRMTDNISSTVPIASIGNTYQIVQQELKLNGFEVMPDLVELSKNRLSIVNSGKLVTQ